MRLTAPTVPVFGVSVILAALAATDVYYHIPHVHPVIAAHHFGMMSAAFVVLAAGVLFAGL